MGISLTNPLRNRFFAYLVFDHIFYWCYENVADGHHKWHFRISSNKGHRRLLNFEAEVRCLLEGGAYFKVREIINIK